LTGWKGDRPRGLADYPAPGCTFELRDAWLAVLDKMIDWAAGLNEADWSRETSYKTLAGVPYKTPFWQITPHCQPWQPSSRTNHQHVAAARDKACESRFGRFLSRERVNYCWFFWRSSGADLQELNRNAEHLFTSVLHGCVLRV